MHTLIVARRKAAGFTLVEVLVAVAIVAILSMIAYPSYLDSTQKSRRADARNALSEGAARQERLFSQSNSYTTAVTDLMTNGTSSDAGYYTMSMTNPSCSTTVSGVTYYSCFTLTATATGTQANDTDCATMTINHLGQKTPAACW